MSKMEMTADVFFTCVCDQTHMAAQCALSTMTAVFGARDRNVVALRALSQLIVAVNTAQWDTAADQLAKIRDAYEEGVTT